MTSAMAGAAGVLAAGMVHMAGDALVAAERHFVPRHGLASEPTHTRSWQAHFTISTSTLAIGPLLSSF